MNIHDFVNNSLDTLATPRIHILHGSRSSYQVCGCTGLFSGALLGLGLISSMGLSCWILAALLLTSVCTFLGLAMASKIITGEERIVYYHHEIAILSTSAILLRVLDQPILPCLDATILGVGAFLAFGRIGCLMVGCCHGRPHAWGVRYGDAHAEEGIPSQFVGARLFPIQAVEAAWAAGVVAVGCCLVLKKYPPGEALAWYVIAYGAGRFCFEFVRGDPARPCLLGFSEGQWTTLLLTAAVLWAEAAGTLPHHPWRAGVAACLVLMMVVAGVRRRFTDRPFPSARDIRDLAMAVDRATAGTALEKDDGINGESPPEAVRVASDSLGIRISAGRIRDSGRHIHHYTLSQKDGHMTENTARSLGSMIGSLKRHTGSFRLLEGSRGVFHLLFHQVE